MTFVFEKTFGKFDSSTNFEGNKLIVEYTLSSVSDGIKVVEMWRVGEDEFGEVGKHYHRMNWMSKDAQANLLDELERDYMDNHSVMAHPDFIEAMNEPTESQWLESKAELHYGI